MKIMRSNYSWVPSLYLMQSLPFALVTGVAPILYKNFNYSNITITFITSLFTIPWFIKPLLAPLFESFVSKRRIVIKTQAIIAGLILLLAMSLFISSSFFWCSIVIFMLLALASSIHDMNSDGLYILNLDHKNQAHFVGVRTLSYQMGKLLIQGILIFFVGYFVHVVGLYAIWQINFFVLAVFIGLISIYHFKFLPHTESALTKSAKEKIPIKTIINELTALPYLTVTLVFVLFYGLPEAALFKIVPLFLLDNHHQKGLGLSTEAVGSIFGGIGFFGMLLGVFIAGLLVEKYSLRKCLLPTTIFTAVTTLIYLLLSINSYLPIRVISLLVFIAQCGFGLSNGIYMIFLLQIFGKGSYPMSQYAIGTSLMCLGMTLAGGMSGYLQYLLGYTHFFIAIVVASVMIILLAWYTARKILL